VDAQSPACCSNHPRRREKTPAVIILADSRLTAAATGTTGASPHTGMASPASSAALTAPIAASHCGMPPWRSAATHSVPNDSAMKSATPPVLQVVHREITRQLLDQTGFKADEAESGAVTLIQRFGSAAAQHPPALPGAGRRVPAHGRRAGVCPGRFPHR